MSRSGTSGRTLRRTRRPAISLSRGSADDEHLDSFDRLAKISGAVLARALGMRRVILQEFLSLDGLASGPDASTDFIPAHTRGDQSFGRRQTEFLDSIDGILLGRVTYEMFASYWPEVTSGEDKPFADRLNALPRTVFTRTLDRAPWGRWDDARIVKSDPVKEVERLKKQPGKDLVIWGSISLARALMSAGAIDEYQLVLLPVVLGDGIAMFGGGPQPFNFRLRETTSFDCGGVLLIYVPTSTAHPTSS